MAIKPLKLKRYISEEEAAQLLSLLIGEDVSADDMATYALDGVVPAYMEYSPRPDWPAYREHGFCLIDDYSLAHPIYGELSSVDGDFWPDILPYPLPSDGWVVNSTGNKWTAFAARSDGGLEAVSSEHYVRIYAPQEICQVAQILNDPMAFPKWPAIIHSHGDTWDNDLDNPTEQIRIIGPYEDSAAYVVEAIKRGRGELPLPENDKLPLNWPLVVAGLLKLLEPQFPKQETISNAIADFKWPGAGKRNVDDAMSAANKELFGPGRKRRRKETAS